MESSSLIPGVPPASRLGLAGSYGIDADGVERAYHDLGINYFFVTTRMKQMIAGLRRLIEGGHRDKLVIATGANLPTGGGVKRSWANVTKALGTDYIDLFQLYWVQAHWYVSGKTWPAMRQLKDEGKVKGLGMSIHNRKLARQLAEELGLDMLMIRYNAAHRGAEQDIFQHLGEKRPAIIAYTATRWGKLLEPEGKLGPMTAGECYRFAIGHPMVNVVLCGPKNYAELEEDVRAIEQGPLDESRLETVKQFGDAVRATASGRISFGSRG